jgi:hypothetical protein
MGRKINVSCSTGRLHEGDLGEMDEEGFWGHHRQRLKIIERKIAKTTGLNSTTTVEEWSQWSISPRVVAAVVVIAATVIAEEEEARHGPPEVEEEEECTPLKGATSEEPGITPVHGETDNRSMTRQMKLRHP